MSPDQKKLSRLAEISAKLNHESDSLNEVIAGLERRLGELRIGVSAWCSERFDETEFTDDQLRECTQWKEFGYTKIRDVWQLCVKETVGYSYGQPDQCGIREWITTDVRISPLSNASRQLRIEMIALFDDLVESLICIGEKYIKNIENAKKVIEDQGESGDTRPQSVMTSPRGEAQAGHVSIVELGQEVHFAPAAISDPEYRMTKSKRKS